MQDMYRLPAAKLEQATIALFTAAGTPEHIAEIVAQILVGANLAGHDSHGVLRIPAYLDAIDNGRLQPAAEPQIERATDNTLLVDGQLGFGHHTAFKAMQWALDKAKEHAICNVAFRRINHIGRLGEYAEQAAKAGCIGLIYSGIGRQDGGATVPFGGAEGRLSTNPIAAGVPTGDDTPFVLDIATSAVAEGKLQVARSTGADVSEGIIVDKEGRPTVKAPDFYAGGHLLPFGAHKGYGLSLLICLLGALSGEQMAENGQVGGTYMQVINVEAFTPLEGYQRTARTFLDWMKSCAPAPGIDEVLVPGDFEQRKRTERQRTGIDLPATIYDQLQSCAERLDVTLDLAEQK